MLLTLKYLGLDIGFNTFKQIKSKTNAIHKILYLTTKIELMRSIGSMNFYSKSIDKLYANMEPFYELLKDHSNFHRN